MKNIILTTLNARYAHSAFGLRYLYANLHELQSQAEILEFNINDNFANVAEVILDKNPKIVGLGVYIWNALQTQELIHILKKVAPDVIIVLGGPEVSYMPLRVDFSDADYIVQGEGEESFYTLAKTLLENKTPNNRIIPMSLPKLKELELPYKYYTDNDIANRYIYVEISRGCPFECEFCLSSMDEKVRSFNLEDVLAEFEILWQRGARNFKFVDRTFNLNIKSANMILDFFLAKKEEYFVHFEVVPDHFPASLRQKIQQFPAGSLQLEIGIQTLNLEIADNISRRLDLEKVDSNVTFLDKQTDAHIHLDLIIGLPGESLESFGKNLDALVALSSCEIQLGILKKLSGTHISRHDEKYGMIYSDKPPYEILKNNNLSFKDLQIMKRFARFWDLYYNSGNFKNTLKLLWQEQSVYENFYTFSLWIYSQTQSTWKISLDRLAQLLFNYLKEEKKIQESVIAQALIVDLLKIKGRALPPYLKPYAKDLKVKAKEGSSGFNKRQNRV